MCRLTITDIACHKVDKVELHHRKFVVQCCVAGVGGADCCADEGKLARLSRVRRVAVALGQVEFLLDACLSAICSKPHFYGSIIYMLETCFQLTDELLGSARSEPASGRSSLAELSMRHIPVCGGT